MRYHAGVMQLKVTYYLEVVSSWCYWAEPMWAELKRRYAGVASFEWRVALMDESGLPKSRAQEDWFYRRSGVIVRSPFMLDGGWLEPGLENYLPANALPEAARGLGFSDDRVRLAGCGVGPRPVLFDDPAALSPPGDFRGSAEYRSHLATIHTARVREALA